MALQLLLVEAFVAIALGVASHVLVFVHSELDNYTISITQSFVTGLVLTIILLSVQVNSILGGIVIGSLLFSLYQFALGTSILVYRVFLHRLSRFPAATPYVVSKWFAARYASRTGRYFAIVKSFHERHGDFVRTGMLSSFLSSLSSLGLYADCLGPCEISINHVDALEVIYADYSLCTRGPWYSLCGPNALLHRTRSRQAHDQQRVFWERGLGHQGHKHRVQD